MTEPVLRGFSMLLVEDDTGDALLVEEMLADAGLAPRLTWVRTIGEAERHLLAQPVDCVLLDLGLPDSVGLAGLRQLLGAAPNAAVVVLTGLEDAERGEEALAVGAQDYLAKNEATPELVGRAVRYAVERKQAEEAARQLREAELLASENARLERGLLPSPLLSGDGVRYTARYLPGRRRTLLGGDFYDLVQGPDGAVHAVIGDVMGHGPDEAALGVALRISWRTLVLAGHRGTGLLGVMEQVLVAERQSDEVFATLCSVRIAPDGSGELLLAGHPPPLLLAGAGTRALEAEPGIALGMLPGEGGWPVNRIELGGRWELLLYTDGLVEGRTGDGPERLGVEGLVRIAHELTDLERHEVGPALLARALDPDHVDDVAFLHLGRVP